MMKSSLAGLLALALIGAGFGVGFGLGAGRRRATAKVAPQAPPSPPLVKNLRVSPNGRQIAFTSVSDGARLSTRFVLNLQTRVASARTAPRGWQDSVTAWTRDNRLVFERERIPRSTDDAKPGIYAERVAPSATPEPLSDVELPDGEKVTGGFLDPSGNLVVRSRRELKSVYALSEDGPRLLASSQAQLYQTRAVRENNRTVYFIASDVPGQRELAALYRIDARGKRRLGPTFESPTWMYLRENARQLIVCQSEGDDWNWTLFDVSPRGLTKRKSATVPGDVIVVYWSPDGKTVLGAGGDDVWAIDVATLHARRLPRLGRNTQSMRAWNADDAVWLSDSRSVLVSTDGVLYRVSLDGGAVQELWRVPKKYWK